MKKVKLGLIVLGLMIGINVTAQTEAVRVDNYNLKGKLGIQGYDPVAYFTKGEALKGDKEIRARFKGVTYYFSSKENQQLFLKGALKYEPQYGGWCAYAMGENGKKVGVDPKTFKILNGKLYLFYNKFGTNTLTLWNENEASLHKKADAYWEKVIKP